MDSVKRLEAKRQLSAVAQTVVFGLGRSKMLDLSMGVDCLPLRRRKATKPSRLVPRCYP